ncbi:MAG: hypothetical protein EPN92_00165 [Chitinophagaceae bacterium]|nr:MAG: hypothetical protein EPN92_00165 [Chitinophagaceae bacterium]
MPVTKKILLLLLPCAFYIAVSFNSSCNVYKFNDVSIADSIKTIKVNYIENKARYINPQLSPQLTDKLRQKIVNQTRLTQVNSDNPHLEISGEIRDYSVSTSAISSQQSATNRLTVGVHITVINHLANEQPKEYDVSRSFEFSATKSLPEAESGLKDEMIRSLVDEIFNRLFSNW